MLNTLINRLTASPFVGVDLGSAACKVVEVARSGSKVALRRAGLATVAGDPVVLLRRTLAEAGITADRAAIGLASPEVVVKPFEMPPMPRKELAAAIQLEAEAAVLNGHAKTDVAVDWHTLASSSRDSVRGLLAVVPKSIMAARVGLVKQAQLQPLIVDVEGLALWNAYWILLGIHEREPKSVFLINVGARTTNLVIGRAPDELMLVRDLQLGAPDASDALARDWVAEIRDSLGYARSKAGLRSLDAVYLTGGGARPGIVPLIEPAVHAPITFWNPFTQLQRDGLASKVDETLGPLFAVALGLALRRPS